MRVLDSYIIRHVIGPFSLGLVVLLMVLSLERLLRLLQLTQDQDASIFKVLEFLFYLLPHYLGLALPASLFLGILLAIRHLQEASEVVIMQSAGLSRIYLYKAIAVLVIPATIIMLLLNGYAQPHARYTYRAELHGLVAENPLVGLRENSFIEIGNDTVLRVNRIRQSDGVLEGVFIARKKEKLGEQLVINAQQALLSHEEGEKKSVLLLENGTLIRENKFNRKVSTLSFQSYPWDLPNIVGEPYGRRGQDEREMTLGELISGGVKTVENQATQMQLKTEFHARLVRALSLPFLALWALPLAFIGTGRTGKAGGIILGGGLFVFYEKIVGLGEVYAANGDVQIWIALWGPFLALGISGWLFMRFKIPTKLRGVKVKS